MTQILRSCPVCEFNRSAFVYENALAAVADLNMSYRIGRCERCGFNFACQLPDDSTYQKYYQSVSKYDGPGNLSSLDASRIEAAVDFCRELIPFDHVIIDLGCGSGALLSHLKSAGWSKLFGVDPAPQSAQCAREHYGITTVHHGSIAQAHSIVPLDEANMICLMAVLEHLPNLRTDMSNLLSHLRPGCKILVEVPAVECFCGLGSEPFGEFSLEHIQFFTKTSLVNFFDSFGARLIKLQVHPLPSIQSGDIFALFEYTGTRQTISSPQPELLPILETYVEESRRSLERALKRIPDQSLIIYGAGSHTARLIPCLQSLSGIEVVAIVDGNPNLLGKTIGSWTICDPALIAEFPDLPILISSYRSQHDIATHLSAQYPNPLITMYA